MRKYNLPKKFRKDWLDALESGEYDQTCAGALFNMGRYCCLGVAGSVLGYSDSDMYPHGMPNQIPNSNVFPKCLLGDSGNRTFAGKLAEMNDGGKTFKQIASYIRKNTKGV